MEVEEEEVEDEGSFDACPNTEEEEEGWPNTDPPPAVLGNCDVWPKVDWKAVGWDDWPKMDGACPNTEPDVCPNTEEEVEEVP